MRKLSPWVWITLLWCAIGLFEASRTVFVMQAEDMHHDWPHLFVTELLSWLAWGAATPVILRLETLRGWRAWLLHPLACLGIGIAAAGWLAWLEELLNPWAVERMPDFPALWLTRFEENVVAYTVLYGTALAISFVLRAREQMARQREVLVQARLDALSRQIEPHFLFNSLNAVVSLIREERSADAIQVTVELSDLLRRVLDESGRQLVPLFEELDFLGKYLDIQKVRFGERLGIAIDRAPDLAMAQVPALLLQPLAENAIKHGIGRRVEGGRLDIRVGRNENRLTIAVENDGPPLPPRREDGIGLANIRARLHSLYGDEAALDIGSGAPGRVLVIVSLPYRTA
jgi:sensor histidine kinase YesM